MPTRCCIPPEKLVRVLFALTRQDRTRFKPAGAPSGVFASFLTPRSKGARPAFLQHWSGLRQAKQNF